MDTTNIVKLAVDAYNGKVVKYSEEQAQDALRQAVVEANNGKSYIDYRDIRDGKCSGLFSIIEDVLKSTTVGGITENDFFNTLVDFKNVAEGDRNMFVVNDNDLFVVAESANGTQGVRRQRLGGKTETPIITTMKVVRIYEELNRILAGRVDFNDMINRVADSFKQKLLDDIYTLWSGATAKDFGGINYFPTAGAYDEAAFIDTINHVEAAAGGKPATILGTKKALRNLKPGMDSVEANSDLYNMGYYGKFYGTPVVAIPQRHKVGTSEFLYPDNVLTVIAGDDRPIKVVYEGDPLVIMGNPTDNADLTQEYFYGEKWGVGLVMAGGNSGIGRYEIE